MIAAVVALVSLAMAGAAQAQQATPSPMSDVEMTQPHPAHIHQGSCPHPGPIAWPLNDVAGPGLPTTMMGTPVSGTPQASPMALSQANATPVGGNGNVIAASFTTVKVNLADLEKSPFAVNVHESLQQIGVYIACGDITGPINGNTLVVQLKELNNSGVVGVATLTDNGDGTTGVLIQLMPAMAS
jgi:hypothetical protein